MPGVFIVVCNKDLKHRIPPFLFAGQPLTGFSVKIVSVNRDHSVSAGRFSQIFHKMMNILLLPDLCLTLRVLEVLER